MQVKIAILAAIAACSSVASAQYAQVLNQCTFPVYLWSATPSGTGPMNTLNAGNRYYEEQYQDLPTGGVALKISQYSDISALYNGSALTQDQYTLNGTLLWYSLADTGGDIFLGHQVTLLPSSGGGGIVWPNGQGASQVLNTASSNNLTLTLCASS